jgi:hypothetical protein
MVRKHRTRRRNKKKGGGTRRNKRGSKRGGAYGKYFSSSRKYINELKNAAAELKNGESSDPARLIKIWNKITESEVYQKYEKEFNLEMKNILETFDSNTTVKNTIELNKIYNNVKSSVREIPYTPPLYDLGNDNLENRGYKSVSSNSEPIASFKSNDSSERFDNPVFVPTIVTVASYNMSFMSDLGLSRSERNYSSEAAFLARLGDNDRTYWINALKLLEDFISQYKDTPCIIGLQEINQTTQGSGIGSDAINQMLQKYPDYVQICEEVIKIIPGKNGEDGKKEKVGISIIYDEVFFGPKKYAEVYDHYSPTNNGRPTLIVFTEMGYLFINTHGAQNPKKFNDTKDNNQKKSGFNKDMIDLNVDNIRINLNTFLEKFNIDRNRETIKRIFITGDFNDRFDAIKEITLSEMIIFNKGGITLKYNGDAPKSCCYNWDSACPGPDDMDDKYHKYIPFKNLDNSDTEYGYCQTLGVGNLKTSMGDRGKKEFYRYRGDKVFGEYPLTDIKMFDNTETKISEESDHQMVFAKFSLSPVPKAQGGRKRKHKTRKVLKKRQRKTSTYV